MSELMEIARRAVAGAAAGEQVEAYVTRTQSTDVAIFDGEVESLSTAVVEGVGVRVVRDRRQGFAWAGSLDESIVADAVAEARDNAAFGAPDEHYGLASPADTAGVQPAALDLWREELAAVAADDKVSLALEVEAATKAADRRVRGVQSAGYGDGLTESAIANSLGVESVSRRTHCAAWAFALAGDGAETKTGYGLAAGRTIADLDAGPIARDAADRACRLLGAVQPAGRRVAVVLDPLVTRSLLGVLSAAFNGEAMLKGRSLFGGREGEEVAARHVSVVDDPTDARSLGAAGHDSEGLPTRSNALISGGVLQGFLHNVYSGRRAGLASTGSAVRAGFKSTPGVGVRSLRFEPGPLTSEEILAAAPEAFYVQSVSGLHSGTNPVSGDFSVGAEGLMVRGGAFAEPVREVTIASTLPRMLGGIVEVGNDLRFLPGGTIGATVLIDDMTLSGA